MSKSDQYRSEPGSREPCESTDDGEVSDACREQYGGDAQSRRVPEAKNEAA